MKINLKSFRIYTLVTTLLSAIFIFPGWFSLSVPLLESFLESDSLYISFFRLPEFIIDHGILTHITNIGGKSVSLAVLILCAVLKYMCVLSSGLAIYGVWKSCIKKRPTRFLISSQIIALVLHCLCIMIVLGFAIAMNVFSGSISAATGFSEKLLNVSFIPTVWFYLSLISCVLSLIFAIKYKKAG